MMVMQNTMPKRMWVSQIQMPPMKNQSTFINMFRHPGCGSLRLICEPKGQMANKPSFMLCNPNGMPMMVIISAKPLRKYSGGNLESAKDNPDNVSYRRH